MEEQKQADPGRTLAIVGLVFSILLAFVGLILCIIAINKSKNAGYKNTIALVGIVIAIINMIVGVVLQRLGIGIFAS